MLDLKGQTNLENSKTLPVLGTKGANYGIVAFCFARLAFGDAYSQRISWDYPSALKCTNPSVVSVRQNLINDANNYFNSRRGKIS